MGNNLEIVYILFDGFTGLCKIGRTKSKHTKRQKKIQGYHQTPLLHVLDMYVENSSQVESFLHRNFSDKRINGEWFKIQLEELVTFVFEKIEWDRIEVLDTSIVIKYICHCRMNNYVEAGKICQMERKVRED